MLFDLHGKTAIVTGGARGIGKGICHCLAEQGANLVIADILAEEAAETVKEMAAKGVQAIAVKTDITDMPSVKNMVAKALETFDKIDILVNNVGWDKMELFLNTTEEDWDKIIGINYRGTLNVTRAVAEHMVTKDCGRIISIGSDAGRVGSMGESIYAGTKGAIIAFVKTMARELARNNITVNCVCPGPTLTPMVVNEMMPSSEFAKKVFSSMEKIIPLRRMGTPEDIGAAVAFLASDEANFITGQVLSVSGGLTMAG